MSTQDGFETVRQAITTLEFYASFYASGSEFQVRKNEIAALLDNRAATHEGSMEGKLLNSVAAVIRQL